MVAKGVTAEEMRTVRQKHDHRSQMARLVDIGTSQKLWALISWIFVLVLVGIAAYLLSSKVRITFPSSHQLC